MVQTGVKKLALINKHRLLSQTLKRHPHQWVPFLFAHDENKKLTGMVVKYNTKSIAKR